MLGIGTVRIFKTKAFARLARQHDVADGSLIRAVDDAARGLVEADLGGGIIKQRVARPGAGKSGGFRVILAFHSETRSVFMYLFAKNDQDNIDDNQLISFRELARVWLQRGWQKGVARSAKSTRPFDLQMTRTASTRCCWRRRGICSRPA